MDKVKIGYILNHYSSLMTNEESIAWRHWSTTYKMQGSSEDQKAKRIELSLKTGWMTNDVDILRLLENGIEEFEKNVAERINREYSIDFNYCPKCKKLTRTPKAKQCRHCGFDWH